MAEEKESVEIQRLGRFAGAPGLHNQPTPATAVDGADYAGLMQDLLRRIEGAICEKRRSQKPGEHRQCNVSRDNGRISWRSKQNDACAQAKGEEPDGYGPAV